LGSNELLLAEVPEVLAILYSTNKQNQLSGYANVVTDKTLGSLMVQIGYRSENLTKFDLKSRKSLKYF